ncbi:polysaccharide deacetylase family protein [Clostridium sp. OS1-26]|uniref:polysaccharide deacetylase family protein n=1 Tax=Clostridium sp. OS1-26 TaxID=3070681 RepID=UPI0027DFCB3B|nr:polysaccharide deacetylase family protein [Clostridium sp. OS1-26]WML36845.1 polysaccharide deacetylase family protein [Clostridium sp. OS1-26]
MKKFSSIICVTFIAAIFTLIQFFLPLNVEKKLSTQLDNSINNVKANEYNLNTTFSNVQNPKEVFLTFDDGPCINNTRKTLKILKDNNVKATFFVVGMKGEENPQILKEISNSGMSIGVHTYSHDYRQMYKNTDAYFKDYNDCQSVIKKITGRNPIVYVRMPGGSDNLVTSKSNLESIKKRLNEKGIKYVDWNVSAGDAESREVSADKIKQNIITQCKDKSIAVILMHDTYYNSSTVEALPDVIKYLKKEGFVFKTLDGLTTNEENRMVNTRVMNRL